MSRKEEEATERDDEMGRLMRSHWVECCQQRRRLGRCVGQAGGDMDGVQRLNS